MLIKYNKQLPKQVVHTTDLNKDEKNLCLSFVFYFYKDCMRQLKSLLIATKCLIQQKDQNCKSL